MGRRGKWQPETHPVRTHRPTLCLAPNLCINYFILYFKKKYSAFMWLLNRWWKMTTEELRHNTIFKRVSLGIPYWRGWHSEPFILKLSRSHPPLCLYLGESSVCPYLLSLETILHYWAIVGEFKLFDILALVHVSGDLWCSCVACGTHNVFSLVSDW